MPLNRRALAAALAAAGTAQAGTVLAGFYRTEMDSLAADFQQSRRGPDYGRGRSLLVDSLIRAAADVFWPDAAAPLVIVATGGYGRGVLAPFSDIDILLLSADDHETVAETLARPLLACLWDAGLKVGYTLRTASNLAAAATEDAITAAALLDARFLHGDNALFAGALHAFRQRLDTDTFTKAKRAEQEQRHAVPAHAPYRVEPNIKEGYGGLRDINTVWWLLKASCNCRDWQEAVAFAALTSKQAKVLQAAEKFHFSVRTALHLLRGKADEKISFAVQPELAALLGYRDRPPLKAMERLLRHYHWHVRRVTDVVRQVLAVQGREVGELADTLAVPLAEGILRIGRYVHLAALSSSTLLQWLRLFAVAAAQQLEVHPEALTYIRKHCPSLTDEQRRAPGVGAAFLDILTGKASPVRQLEVMTDIGLLGAFLPDYGRIVGLMQYDLNHVYTVDEHTLQALGWLHRLAAGELGGMFPKAHEVYPQISSYRVLYMAVLLHDIAKGRGGDHSELGAVVAREVCPRLGLDAAETETVAWLVEHHLLLSFYAFRRDIHDPDTLLRLVATVQSVERLRLLFVLTVVDIKATNPGLLNEWKASLLRDLFNAAEQHLGGGLVVVGRERQVMLAQLPFADGHGRLAETRQQLFTQIPQAYWLSLPAETHARHIPLLEEYQAAGEAIAVSCHPLPARQATEMTVLAPDQTGVFACMAGTMTLARVSIREARIFTLHSGVAFNTFIVESFDGGALWDDQAERVRLRLQAVLQGAFDIVPSLEKGIILPAFDALHPAQVSFDNHTSKTSTILEIRTPDFPGLLYQVASVLWREKIRIDRAKVDTFSRMASDIFYIRNRYGLKIERLEQQQALREMLYQAVFANNKTGA